VEKKRLYHIDLLRFIAAISVVLYHYTFRGHMADNLSDLKFGFLANLFKYGYLGVDLFFIISGFVIAFSIEKSDFISFVKSRFIRLFPAYWICLFITSFIIIFLGNDRYHVNLVQFLANLTMLNGFVKIENIDGVYWSLFLELKFYIIISLVLLNSKIKKNIYYIMIGWLLISYLHFVLDFQSNIFFKAINYLFFFEYSSYFISGVMFYKIFKYGNSKKYSFAILFSFILSLLSINKHVAFLNDHYQVNFSIIIISIFISIFYILFYLISTHNLNILNKSFFLNLGVITYPLYLIHQYVGFILFNYFHQKVNKNILLLSVFLLMILISYLINKYFEVPISKKIKSILFN